ncbi:MAG: threonylcarbamoyl-AMP synthase [Alphaproteobacteria bacterium]|nr:threonylcarbamoyl-AMP synthase [Alphaproteobacteria bacterium]
MTTLDWQDIRRAAEILRAGGLVAIPTETVYGLAADATNDDAVARIFEAKGRPRFNPLIVHVRGMESARAQAEFSPLAEKLAGAFWPGPLTLVLPRRPDASVSLLVSAGLDTVALRAPAHPIARAVIERTGAPLAAPSANRSGSVSPTSPAHVRESLGDKVDMILNGGPCAVGLESTILKIEGEEAKLLRPGGIALRDIENVIGRSVIRADGARIEAPGMMTSHYAPESRLRLDVAAPERDEAYLAFGPVPASHPHTLNLSGTGDLREAAGNLFAHLRALDALVREKKLKGIAAAPIPQEGLGEAINDRLARAAAPRP